MNTKQKTWYSAKDAAEMAQLPLQFVIQLCDDGILEHISATGFDPYVSSEALADVLRIKNGNTDDDFYEKLKSLPKMKNISIRKEACQINVLINGITRTKYVSDFDKNMSVLELQMQLENQRDTFIEEQIEFLKDGPPPMPNPPIFEPHIRIPNVYQNARMRRNHKFQLRAMSAGVRNSKVVCPPCALWGDVEATAAWVENESINFSTELRIKTENTKQQKQLLKSAKLSQSAANNRYVFG